MNRRLNTFLSTMAVSTMKNVKSLIFCCVCLCAFFSKIVCANNRSTGAVTASAFQESNKGLIEEGRTFMHHMVKRFMVILPAIFFKLGIAFTLLVLVAIVAVNNGFIGFLILVVGLSSVLARLQDGSRNKAYPVPIYAPAPFHGHPFIDRSDAASNPTYTNQKFTAQPNFQKRNDVDSYNNQISNLNYLVAQNQPENSYGNAEVVYGKYIVGK